MMSYQERGGGGLVGGVLGLEENEGGVVHEGKFGDIRGGGQRGGQGISPEEESRGKRGGGGDSHAAGGKEAHQSNEEQSTGHFGERKENKKEGRKEGWSSSGHKDVTPHGSRRLQPLTWCHVVLTAARVCVCAGWRLSFVDSGGHSKTLKRHDTDIHNPGHPAISEKEDDGSSRGWGGDDGQWRGGGDHA